MSVLAELGSFLQTRGVGTVGSDLFLGTLPDVPDACGALREYPGPPPELGFGALGLVFETPAVQVVFRGAPNSYPAPRAKAEAAYRALAELQVTNVSGADYLIVTPQQAPFLLERDDKLRPVIAFNVHCYKRLS